MCVWQSQSRNAHEHNRGSTGSNDSPERDVLRRHPVATQRVLQRGVSEGEPRRRVINVEEIKLIVHVGQKAVSGHKPRVAFNRLIKQISSFQKMWFLLGIKTMVVRDWLRSHVETKRN